MHTTGCTPSTLVSSPASTVADIYYLAIEVPSSIFFTILARVVGEDGDIQINEGGYVIYPRDVESGRWIANTLATLGHQSQFMWNP
jgi:hypothetical protein